MIRHRAACSPTLARPRETPSRRAGGGRAHDDRGVDRDPIGVEADGGRTRGSAR